MSNNKEKSNWTKIVNALLLLLIVITLLSTLHTLISPLLPDESEYIGTFPENFSENVNEWLTNGIVRHLVLFNEYFNINWVLGILSQIFFILLLVNIKKVLGESEASTEVLLKNYTNWAISGILVSIVFITKSINVNTAPQIGLASIGFCITILLLLFISKHIDKTCPKD